VVYRFDCDGKTLADKTSTIRMIQETIVTTVDAADQVHIAPMGIHIEADGISILPFKPSKTLDNILATGVAVINHCDDVRVFAGCLTGRRDWPVTPAKTITGVYLTATLAHVEVSLQRMADDQLRPTLFCKAVHTVNHRPFQGFNRAQFAVLEAAILISRLDRLPWQKIESELDYLRIGFEKTAGSKEREAWQWLMDEIDSYRLKAATS